MSAITLTFSATPYPSAIAFTALTRADNGASVSYTTNWASSGGGAIWTGTFVAPAAGLTYNYSATATVSGVAYPFSYVYVDIATGYAGRYTSSDLLNRRFGSLNIATYSNTAGGDTIDQTSVQDAIQDAEDEIDAYFNGSIYTIPFVATGASLPKLIQEWATVKAGWWLYTKRGLRDEKAGGDLQKLKDDVEKQMLMYRAGYPRQLRGVQFSTAASVGAIAYNPDTGSTTDGRTITNRNSQSLIRVRYIEGYGITFQH